MTREDISLTAMNLYYNSGSRDRQRNNEKQQLFVIDYNHNMGCVDSVDLSS